MYFVIDGYNVLKMVNSKREITQHERLQFIAQLASYAYHKQHQILVVFDGGPDWWPSTETIHGITVTYSGARLSADDYIKNYIQQYKKKDLLLISSDKELVKTVEKEFAIESIGALDFYYLVNQEVTARVQYNKHMQTPLFKRTKKTDPELDQLMKEGSSAIQKKEELAPIQLRHSPSVKLSKKERKLMQKLKKI